ncbi:hypothetical protein, partial [Microbacterium sp.]|uniref:hypothetical protein n=1 Tax=Microbacterium sp. TaxID=51671 RepID=UPI0037C911E1
MNDGGFHRGHVESVLFGHFNLGSNPRARYSGLEIDAMAEPGYRGAMTGRETSRDPPVRTRARQLRRFTDGRTSSGVSATDDRNRDFWW